MLFILLFYIGLGAILPWPVAADGQSSRDEAIALIEAGDLRRAEKVLKQLDKGGQATGKHYLMLGEAYRFAGDGGRARSAFKKAIKLGEAGEGYLGIGKVYRDRGAHGQMALVNFRKALGEDPELAEAQYQIAQIYRAVRPLDAEKQYRAALTIDPTHPDAYYQLGKLLEDEGRMPEAKAAYHRQLKTNPAHGYAGLHLGRRMYEEGKKKTAARIFSDLMDAGGQVETESYLEMALMSYDAQDYGSSQRLFEAHIDRLPEQDQEHFSDITHVASREDLDALDAVAESERDEMRRRYWARQDPAPLSAANERLLEHYRRVAYSRRQFSEGEYPFDERGRAYVRLGRPDHVSRSGDIQGEMEQHLIDARYNFVDRMRLGVEVRPGWPSYPVRSGDRWEYWLYAGIDKGFELTFTSRFSDGKYRFAEIPTQGSLAAINEALALHGENIVAEASMEEASRYIADFADLPVDFYYYPASYRGVGDSTRLELYYGLPADDIARSKGRDGDLVVFDRGVALYDTTWQEVHRVVDRMTFRAPSDQQVEAGAFIPGVMPAELTPGDYWMSLQIRDRGSNRSQVYKQRIRVDDYSSRDSLLISDIELAFHISESDATDEFAKNGLRVIPMSSKAFRRDQNAYVYFELYNLARDEFGQTQYRVEYTVRSYTERSVAARILRGLGRVLQIVEGEQEVKVSFEQTGSDATDLAYVELGIRESKPGGQTVKVRVTDLLTEQSAEKSIRFSVDAF